MGTGFDWASFNNQTPDLEKKVAEAKEARKEANIRGKQKRLWLPVGADKKVIILDDDPFTLEEHGMLINGTRKGNWFTCGPLDTQIATSLGHKTIESIAVGDRVLTHEGREREVKATMTRMYQGDMVTLRAAKVGEVTMTANHRMWALRNPGKYADGRIRRADLNRQAELIEMKDLKVGDYLWVPTREPVKARDVDLGLAWLLGLYAADGSTSTEQGIVEITLGGHQKLLAERVKHEMQKHFGIQMTIFDRGNCLRVKSRANMLAKLKEWCGADSANKKLPDFVVRSESDEVIEAALGGLMAGDGYQDSYHITYTTISKVLADQVFSMWMRLGFNPAIRVSNWSHDNKYDKCERKTVYLVQRPVKGRQYGSHLVSDGMFVEVKKKTSRRVSEPVFNLTVDGDNSYVVGQVAVANCIKKLAALAEENDALKVFKGGCPFCQINEPYFVGFVTCLVVSSFKLDRGPDKGKVISNYRNLIPMKIETLEWFQKEKRDRKSLVGALYRFSRTKKSGQAAFGVPSFLEKVDLSEDRCLMSAKDQAGNDVKVPPVAFTKEEYSTMFEPLTHSKLTAMAKEIRAGNDGSSGGGGGRKKGFDDDDDGDEGGDEGGGSGGDDEIPF